MVGSYDSVYDLREIASILADKGDVEKALRLIQNLVERIITEPLCTSHIFGSKRLDDLCQHVGKINLADIMRNVAAEKSFPRDQPVFAYIVTKLQKSGGHTRVIQDFIRAKPGSLHVILSTELDGRSDIDYLATGFAQRANVVFEPAPKANYRERLTWLQKRLLTIHPQKLYLFNHHQDSVAVAAIQPEMGLDATFYHHGDHHLCLGVYLSHLKHVDPHPMGYHNCRDALGIKNSYVPLTVDDKGKRVPDAPFLLDGVLTTCTAARANKVEIPYFVSYLELVPKLLNATKGRHIHIGRLTPWGLFKIRRGLKSYGIGSDQFIYIPWVPSVWKALHEFRVDLYVASFPYGGGLTLIEAMGAGIPVALHRHICSKILSGIDLAYRGAFSWRFIDELLTYCTSLTASRLEEAGRLGRIQYEKFYSWRNFQEALNSTTFACPKPSNLSDGFSVESDEWALWMERQVNLRRIIFRATYRTFRRLRAR